MLHNTPPCDERKRKGRSEAAQNAKASEENYNSIWDPKYGPSVAKAMLETTENKVPFDLVARLMERIASMSTSGSILIFLPGLNIISP
ncbi:hypothetical protein FBUS_11607 [Fasciolopsis buskii]|uniref:Uncharacterized protein n=1 Tax=Fasciolopsis buskii TaxID=27845 RepID=A0A8E0S0E2_9TREM|nr:hypothetical protein FBUS_11607 [Fasciolopsis buski]